MSHQPLDPLQLRSSVILSTVRALLDKITPNVRQIGCSWTGDEIKLTFVFASSYSESEKEDAEVAGSEVIADFPTHSSISVECIVVPPPQQPAELIGDSCWVYIRKE